MKKLLLLFIPIALLCACADKPHKTELSFDKAPAANGLQIISAKDTFNKYNAKYHIAVAVKNNSKDKFDNVIVSFQFFDETGDKTAETNTAIKGSLAAGDIATIENTTDVNSYKTVPYKVKITVADMFK